MARKTTRKRDNGFNHFPFIVLVLEFLFLKSFSSFLFSRSKTLFFPQKKNESQEKRSTMPSRTPREARKSASLLVLSLVIACACVSAPSAFAQEANDTASSNTTPTSSVEKMQFHEAAHEENEEAEIGRREKLYSSRNDFDEKVLIFSGPAYGGCCDDPLNLLSCCAKGESCCPASDPNSTTGMHHDGAVFLECCNTKTGTVSINVEMSDVKVVMNNGRCCSSSSSSSSFSNENSITGGDGTSSLKCCEEQNGCCSKREGTTLDCCFSNPIDEVDLTEDKDEEVKKNSGEENNGNDISEDVREDVKSLVDATAYTPGNNGRFTWENLKVPIPAVVKKVMAERTEEEARDGEEEEQDHVEQETTAPTGQDETRKTFKTLLDISSFKNKNEILRSALGFGIFIIVASYIVGATYTREDGREVSGNARGWSGVREERENLYDSAFKAYASV